MISMTDSAMTASLVLAIVILRMSRNWNLRFLKLRLQDAECLPFLFVSTQLLVSWLLTLIPWTRYTSHRPVPVYVHGQVFTLIHEWFKLLGLSKLFLELGQTSKHPIVSQQIIDPKTGEEFLLFEPSFRRNCAFAATLIQINKNLVNFEWPYFFLLAWPQLLKRSCATNM